MSYDVGIHLGIPDDEYRTLPGLSSTGIKRMLDSPAVYDWHRRHPEPPKKEFDLGTAVHNRVLGVGPEEVVVEGPWNTNAKKAEIAEAREAGKIVVKPEQAEQADVLEAAVLAHPDASTLLSWGDPEVTLIWDDPVTGVRCKGRIDYWHESPPVAVDLKTIRDARPWHVAKHAADYRYPEQAEHYADGVEVLTGTRPRFLHIFVQTEGPPEVAVDDLALFADVAQQSVRTAVEMYRDCTESGVWPGIPPGIHRIEPPRWYSAKSMEEYV